MNPKAIIITAVMVGGIGGLAWSSLSAPATPAPAPRKATVVALPASPEERPAALDKEWTARSDDAAAPASGPAMWPGAGPASRAAASAARVQSVHYAGCNEVRAAGKAPLYSGQPGYSEEMDGDGDGIACEPHPGV